jgi:hypothetical protein
MITGGTTTLFGVREKISEQSLRSFASIDSIPQMYIDRGLLLDAASDYRTSSYSYKKQEDRCEGNGFAYS